MNSHAGAEKHMRHCSTVAYFLRRGYALLAASASLLWGTESTTRSISSGLQSLLRFLPGFLGPPSPWLSVIAPWSCSFQKVSRSLLLLLKIAPFAHQTPERTSAASWRLAHTTRSFLCPQPGARAVELWAVITWPWGNCPSAGPSKQHFLFVSIHDFHLFIWSGDYNHSSKQIAVIQRKPWTCTVQELDWLGTGLLAMGSCWWKAGHQQARPQPHGLYFCCSYLCAFYLCLLWFLA